MDPDKVAVTAEGAKTPASEVASIVSIMEPRVFSKLDADDKKACTLVCKAWATWLHLAWYEPQLVRF